MDVYIPIEIFEAFKLMLLVILGFFFGFFIGTEWERIDQKEKKNVR